MGITEDKLKEYILAHYKSIREFTKELNIPYSTVDSIFKRGIRNASIDNIIKICELLNISVDALVEGEIKTKVSAPTTIAAHLDVSDFSEAEQNDLANYIEYIRMKRDKK